MHIDSYKKIKYLEGYKINLRNVENLKINNKSNNKKNLWLVNIGGYDPSSMQENHKFRLVIATNKLEAKNIDKSKWIVGCKKKHKDDISPIETLISCDYCKIIKKDR